MKLILGVDKDERVEVNGPIDIFGFDEYEYDISFQTRNSIPTSLPFQNKKLIDSANDLEHLECWGLRDALVTNVIRNLYDSNNNCYIFKLQFYAYRYFQYQIYLNKNKVYLNIYISY